MRKTKFQMLDDDIKPSQWNFHICVFRDPYCSKISSRSAYIRSLLWGRDSDRRRPVTSLYQRKQQTVGAWPWKWAAMASAALLLLTGNRPHVQPSSNPVYRSAADWSSEKKINLLLFLGDLWNNFKQILQLRLFSGPVRMISTCSIVFLSMYGLLCGLPGENSGWGQKWLIWIDSSVRKPAESFFLEI
jgi:hypothetical protein